MVWTTSISSTSSSSSASWSSSTVLACRVRRVRLFAGGFLSALLAARARFLVGAGFFSEVVATAVALGWETILVFLSPFSPFFCGPYGSDFRPLGEGLFRVRRVDMIAGVDVLNVWCVLVWCVDVKEVGEGCMRCRRVSLNFYLRRPISCREGTGGSIRQWLFN